FGTGAKKYTIQKRPTWNPGKIPAHITANSVIASAARLMEVRHFCRVRNRIAEIKVPAWPIPIQNTKFTMAHPHPTGWLLPHTPTPVDTRYTSRRPRTPAKAALGKNRIHHSNG